VRIDLKHRLTRKPIPLEMLEASTIPWDRKVALAFQGYSEDLSGLGAEEVMLLGCHGRRRGTVGGQVQPDCRSYALMAETL